LFWVALSHLWRDWRSILVIVKPETVIKWHRQGFNYYWRWKSRSGRVGRPRIILTPLPMSGSELRFLRKETRLKPKDFAEQLGVDRKTIANWENSPKLSRQSDVTVRVLVATKLWKDNNLTDVLTQLSKLAEHSWEDVDETAQEIAELAEQNTIMRHANQGWDMSTLAALILQTRFNEKRQVIAKCPSSRDARTNAFESPTSK
jgi:transcriptional regulator with XRE-family HTH domain